MKRSASFFFLALAGFICGAAVGLINTAFVPNCGEDCSSERLANGMQWGLALLIIFPMVGAFLFRKIGNGCKQAIGIAALLSVTTLMLASAAYGYGLHHRYWKSAWQFELPNPDFSSMVIATKPVEATLSGTRIKVQIKAWERCAFSFARCDEQLPTVDAICFGSRGVVLIDEADWSAFARIQDEDLKGLDGEALAGAPRDMRLCASSPR